MNEFKFTEESFEKFKSLYKESTYENDDMDITENLSG